MKHVYSETPESMKGMGEYRYDSSLYVCGMEKDNLLAVGEI